MAKRRKLSELISEETKQPNLPDSQATNSVTPEVLNPGILEVTDLQTNKVPNLQTNEVTETVTNGLGNSESSKLTKNQTHKVTETVTNELGNSESSKLTKNQTHKVPDLQTNEVPKYLTLVRKEARLREDQLDDLTSLTRSINRKRRGTGERITENTIIRVAVDLLLDKSGELKGFTEQELKDSVTP